jgi:hypothetical protein
VLHMKILEFDYGRFVVHEQDSHRPTSLGVPAHHAGSLLSAAPEAKNSVNLEHCPFAVNCDYPPVTVDYFLRTGFGITCSRKSSADHSSWESIQT